MLIVFSWIFIIALASCDPDTTPPSEPDPVVPPSSLTFKCRSDTTIYIGEPQIPISEIEVESPMVISDCQMGQYVINSNLPDVLTPGQHHITYLAYDQCGNAANCSYTLSVIYDYRWDYLGTYNGTYRCSSFPNPHPYPMRDTFVEVSLSLKPDHLFVGDDEVFVDSTGKFPYPSTGGYRFYGFHFENDSLHRYQIWGVINSQSSCYFHGKKE